MPGPRPGMTPKTLHDEAMRPLVLNPLFAALTSLPGVGPKLERLYARLLDRDQPRVIDLLFHCRRARSIAGRDQN